MAEDRAGVRTADCRQQAVAFGDLLDQAGIGAGVQVFNGNVVGPAFAEIVFHPGIGRLAAGVFVAVLMSFSLEL